MAVGYAQLLLRKGDYLDGSFVKPERVDGYINGVNPGDRADHIGRYPFSEQSVDQAVDHATSGNAAWRRLSFNDRAASVRRFRDALGREQERISWQITRETGKPLWEARQEVLAALRAVDLLLDDGIELLAPKVLEEIGARSDRLPRGVVALLTPYTFPLLLPATQSAAALLTGNAVVFKPSKYTPGLGQCVAELWDQCRLPRGAFNLVQGPGAVVGHRLVTSPKIDAVVFSGSYGTALSIRGATAHRPELPTVLHCGGKATALVLEDADLERAVYEVAVGAFLSTGQRHSSTARVMVVASRYNEFVEALMRRVSRFRIGNGLDPDVFLGPLVSENLRTRYRRFARGLSAAGHKAILEAGQENVSSFRGFYAKPAIYAINLETGQPFLDEEPPGPLLLVYKVEDWEHAISLHNQTAFRLATSVFTASDSRLLPELRERLRTGALNVNRSTIGASQRMPSVGLGRSANGYTGGLDLVFALSSPRAQIVESRPFDPSAHLPGTRWNEPEPRARGLRVGKMSVTDPGVERG